MNIYQTIENGKGNAILVDDNGNFMTKLPRVIKNGKPMIKVKKWIIEYIEAQQRGEETPENIDHEEFTFIPAPPDEYPNDINDIEENYTPVVKRITKGISGILGTIGLVHLLDNREKEERKRLNQIFNEAYGRTKSKL